MKHKKKGNQNNGNKIKSVTFHHLTEEETYKFLDSNIDGLSTDEVEKRLKKYGRNLLPSKEPPILFQVIFHQFKSPLIYILLIAGSVALAMQDFKDAAFIFAVVFLNATIGTIQEWRAEQSAHSLQQMLKIQAKVKRSGRQLTVSAEELVPGDVVLLESGDKVPADIRLLQTNNLAIDEAFLTGESLPVEKKPSVLPEETPVSDRLNMSFAGAKIITGRGKGLVSATATATEVGKIARSLVEEEAGKPPLVIRMEKFAKQISIIVVGFAAILGFISIMRGMVFGDVFFLMVAMAVSAIPEGLPVALTVALSIATSRMSKRKVIARKLVAVESLGSCTTIASDKTGTLTVNQQTVKLIELPGGIRIKISGQGYNDEGNATLDSGEMLSEELNTRLTKIAKVGILCNEASLTKENDEWHHSGDSMDVALLSLGYKLGLEPPKIRSTLKPFGEIPFESENRFAASAYRTEKGIYVVVKGAVESVVNFCSEIETFEGNKPLNKHYLFERAEFLAESGYRVLTVATGIINETEITDEFKISDLKNLKVVGLIGFIDPLRPEVKEAVQKAFDAGVNVVMITGDHPATALAIAKELGITESRDNVISGKKLEEIGTYEGDKFLNRIKDVLVFARVSPQQKLCIVEGLMKLGNFVAVTGDGVNDAPALNKANIGVAMGSGAEIAKDAAQIIISDNNFASIVAGIEEGRFAYSNVRKVTLLLISTGAAELIFLGAATILELGIPLLAVQILWLNLVTNGIQDVALAFEAGEKQVMKLPPRKPKEGIFNRRMIEQVLVSGITMGVVCLLAWIYFLNQGFEETDARNSTLLLLVLMQFYHVMNCRSEFRSAFKVPLKNNIILMIGIVVAFSLNIVATELPLLQSLLRTQPLPIEKWLVLGGIASIVIIVVEIYKWLRPLYRQGI
ncbi:MAG: HAD-IC family P-type ATPase [Ignavibacteria bacterium]|nr:HAD-IC family P-type ATPase [Ignavibacteria bacterium]